MLRPFCSNSGWATEVSAAISKPPPSLSTPNNGQALKMGRPAAGPPLWTWESPTPGKGNRGWECLIKREEGKRCFFMLLFDLHVLPFICSFFYILRFVQFEKRPLSFVWIIALLVNCPSTVNLCPSTGNLCKPVKVTAWIWLTKTYRRNDCYLYWMCFITLNVFNCLEAFKRIQLLTAILN